MGKKSKTPSAWATAVASATESFSHEDLVFIDKQEANDLSNWELVDPSDADSDTESLHSIENGFVSWYALYASSSSKSPNSEPQIQTDEALHDLVDEMNSCIDHVNGGFDDDNCCYSHESRDRIYQVGYWPKEEKEEYEEDEDEAEDEEDGYGLNDELVPWQVSGKLGRERMRKLGKRGSAKLGSSKRNPYSYVKPGCVRGKHGLGIKA